MKKLSFPPPLEAELLLTNKCNMRCPHCCANAGECKERNELSIEEWKNVINDLLKLGVQTFTLTGGEPLLYSGFFELLELILENDKFCSITTNGYYIEENIDQILKLVKDKNKTSFHISIDGIREHHDKFRRTENAYSKALNAIKLLKKNGIIVNCNFMLTDESYNDFYELEKELYEAGCNTINIGQFAPVGRNKEIINYKNWMTYIREITQKKASEQIKCNVRCMTHGLWQLYIPLNDKKEDIQNIWGKSSEVIPNCGTCPAGVFTVAINSYGDVYPCDLMTTYDDLICGNINEYNIVKIWNESIILNELRNIDYKFISPCNNCFIGDECHGGCRAAAYSYRKELTFHDYRCPLVENSPFYNNYKYSFPKDKAVYLKSNEKNDIEYVFENEEKVVLFNKEIKLIRYNNYYIAKSSWPGNSFVIFNKFGYIVIKLISIGKKYDDIINILSFNNNKIREKVNFDLYNFILKLSSRLKFIKKELHELMMSSKNVIEYLYEGNDLPEFVFKQINETNNYLVYVKKTQNIKVINSYGKKVLEEYLNNKDLNILIDNVYGNISIDKKIIEKDITNFLKGLNILND